MSPCVSTVQHHVCVRVCMNQEKWIHIFAFLEMSGGDAMEGYVWESNHTGRWSTPILGLQVEETIGKDGNENGFNCFSLFEHPFMWNKAREYAESHTRGFSGTFLISSCLPVSC